MSGTTVTWEGIAVDLADVPRVAQLVNSTLRAACLASMAGDTESARAAYRRLRDLQTLRARRGR